MYFEWKWKIFILPNFNLKLKKKFLNERNPTYRCYYGKSIAVNRL